MSTCTSIHAIGRRPGIIKRLYGISRLTRGLDDLEIAQCIFAGEDSTNPNHVPIIAHGNGINVHHCLFRGSKISVVYWTPGSTGHTMTHCVCRGALGARSAPDQPTGDVADRFRATLA